MDTSIPMSSSGGSLIDGLKALVTPDVVSRASTTYGESEAAISKGLGAALPVVLGAVALKSSDRSFMSRVFDLARDPAADSSPGYVANLLSAGGAGLPGMSLGSRLLSMLFGTNHVSLDNSLSNYAGVRPSTASSMLTLAGPLVLGFLGRMVRSEGMDVTQFTNTLATQKSTIMRLVPSSLSTFLGTGPIVDATYRTAPVTSSQPSAWRWVLPLALLALAIWGLTSLLGRRTRPEEAVTVPRQVPATVTPPVAAPPPPTVNITKPITDAANYISKTLPGGTQLSFPRTGIEGKLVNFIEDPSQPVSTDLWFDFDRLLFETNSAVLKPESNEQLHNIAEIMTAYPKVSVKIGGYTDNSGNAQANLALSQARANTVMNELQGLGISGGRITAEGYGQQHPVADNSTEEGRAQNRRVSLRVTQK